jgi:hypothetical protein
MINPSRLTVSLAPSTLPALIFPKYSGCGVSINL